MSYLTVSSEQPHYSERALSISPNDAVFCLHNRIYTPLF